jgi:DNA polymerase (family 10)
MANQVANQEVVKTLKEVLAAMEVKNFNRFRIRAYQNAIAAMDNLTVSIQDLWETNRLDEIPGVGTSLKEHLTELFTHGKVADFEKTLEDLPQGMFELIKLRGVGAKKAFKLASKFKLHDRSKALKELKKMAEKGKIQVLAGFGEKSEQQILEAITEAKQTKKEKPRLLLFKAEQVAQRLITYMEKCKEVKRIDPLGSLRRRMTTVGDIDVAVATNDNEAVMKHFLKYSEIGDVLTKGDKMSTVLLKNDLQIDLLLIEPKSYGSMLQHFTGSKNHNVLLRTYALDQGMSLSQYGIKKKEELYEYASEEEFYNALGLDYISPELREGMGEIELARDHALPKLVEIADIKGDLHMHTIASDGANTINEMVEKAIELGYEYIGISDHSPSVQTRGLEEVTRIINEKRKNIDELNAKQDKIKILFGYEVNILADATISLPLELLKKLDYVIAGIHTSFKQDRRTITDRLLAAIRHPQVDIIAHPAGRIINQRDALDVIWKEVLAACKKYGKILEISCQPDRLDLPEDLVKEAREMGIRLVVSSDAHDVFGMDLMPWGLDVARRGWCEKNDIVNTLPLTELENTLS